MESSINFMTKQEAAQLLRVSIRTVSNWIKRGELPVLRLGRTIRICESDLATMTQKANQQR